MKFLERLFGKKPQPTARDDELITVFDAYGREVQIRRKDWRDNVLMATLERHRNDADQLYSVLVQSLQDGFFEEVLPFAKRLQTIDPNPSRASCLLGAIYLELDRVNDAERTFKDTIKKHGEEAYVLGNLAKVYSRQGKVAEADATLWRSLELDPNQEIAFHWLWTQSKERGGDRAAHEALHKLAGMPGSWRARVWIARSRLEQNEVEAALRNYEEALAAAPKPVPADLLMQMSGDLGNHGQLVELLKRVTPVYEAAIHGLPVGNNLIKANVDLGRLDHARALVDQLYGLGRPDYAATLSFWDAEIAKARVAGENGEIIAPVSMTMLQLRGPIWLADESPAASLFPSKSDDAVVVAVLGSSAETGATAEPHLQMPDRAGRISRAVPLFLAEQIHLRTTACGQVLQPWMAPGSFVLSGKPWDSETGIDQAKACQPPADYVILIHVEATSPRHRLEFRLVRCIDGTLLASGACDLDPDDVEPSYRELAERVLNALGSHARLDRIPQPSAYRVPEGGWFNDYQLRLEQSLAIRAAALPDTRRDFLSGEREIIGGMLHLCLACPDSISTRVLLLDAVRRLKDVCPQIVSEFRDKLAILQRDHPVPEPARHAVDELLAVAARTVHGES